MTVQETPTQPPPASITRKGCAFEYRALADNSQEYLVRPVQSSLESTSLLKALFILLISFLLWRSLLVHLMIPLLIAITLFFLWTQFNAVESESLLVVRDVGIQVRTTRRFSRTSTRFIDRARIVDMIIIEGLTLLRFRPYLAIVVDGDEKMTINLLPPLDILQSVRNGAKPMIF
ncbi:MAG: hypothetical protein DHS80DRAFT_33154 [Piptocephalis tieghemiana]|nr:MAG: hypothetical protein DHS80DRAFT_33154 [Piptocephalis tieghemiana]